VEDSHAKEARTTRTHFTQTLRKSPMPRPLTPSPHLRLKRLEKIQPWISHPTTMVSAEYLTTSFESSHQRRRRLRMYSDIVPAQVLFYQHKTDKEYNKTLMLRLIQTDKQAGVQCAVDAYFVRIDDIESIGEDVKWYFVHTALQWKI
jgi:hypothetical protein